MAGAGGGSGERCWRWLGIAGDGWLSMAVDGIWHMDGMAEYG